MIKYDVTHKTNKYSLNAKLKQKKKKKKKELTTKNEIKLE